MKKQLLVAAAFLLCALSGTSVEASHKKGFFGQLTTVRPYKNDLRLSIGNIAELNLTQLGNIYFSAKLTAFLALGALWIKAGKKGAFNIPQALDNWITLRSGLFTTFLVATPAAIFTYRTFNAERFLPISFDVDTE